MGKKLSEAMERLLRYAPGETRRIPESWICTSVAPMAGFVPRFATFMALARRKRIRLIHRVTRRHGLRWYWRRLG